MTYFASPHAADYPKNWSDDRAPIISKLRTYQCTRAKACQLRLAGEIDKAGTAEMRAEELLDEARVMVNPNTDGPDAALVELIVLVESHADDLAASPTYDALGWKLALVDTQRGRTERGLRTVERMLGSELTPSKADGDILLSKGYDPRSWAPYIIAQADDCGVPIGRACAVWSTFGPTEAFDGFVTTLQGMEGDDA